MNEEFYRHGAPVNTSLSRELQDVRATRISLQVPTPLIRRLIREADEAALPLADYCVQKLLTTGAIQEEHHRDPAEGCDVALIHPGKRTKERVILIGSPGEDRWNIEVRAKALILEAWKMRVGRQKGFRQAEDDLDSLEIISASVAWEEYGPSMSRYLGPIMNRAS